MLRLATASLRYRLSSFLGSFLTLSLAVTVLGATGIVIQSGLQTEQTSNPLAAASLVVANDPTWVAEEGDGSSDRTTFVPPERPRVPASLVQQVQQVPGVRTAAGDVAFYAQAFTTAGQPLGAGGASEGHPWTSAPLAPWRMRDGSPPSAPADVVLDETAAAAAGVRPGDTVHVITQAGPQESFRVSGIAAAGGPVAVGKSVLFFTATTADRLAQAGGAVDLVGVVAQPGTSVSDLALRLRQELASSPARPQVLTSAQWLAQQPAATGFQEAVTSFGGILGLIGGFVSIFVLSTMFSLQVLQRRREIALLRAVGATPGQVRTMVLGEALIIALAAAATGCVAAPFVGRALGNAAANAGLLPGLVVVVGPLPLLLGAVAGIVVTLLAVVLAARRAAAIRPLEALRETAAERRRIGLLRLIVGILFTAGTLGLEIIVALVGGAQATAGIAAQGFLLLTGLALLSPLLAPFAAQVICGAAARVTRATGRLARENSVANPRRTASAAAPLMLVATLSALLFSIQATFGRIDAEQAAQVIAADRVVSAGGGAPGLPRQVAQAASGLPEVAAASGVVVSTVYLPQNANPDAGQVPSWTLVSAAGVDPRALDTVLSLRVKEGSLAQLDGDSVAISSEGSPVDGLHAGQRLQVRMPDGTPVSVRVAAVLTGAVGVAQVFLPRTLLESQSTQDLDQMVLVKARPGADGQRLDADLDRLTADYPTVVVQRTADYLAGQNQAESTASRTATYLVLGLGLLFAGVATVNTLMIATAERAREFALLRLVGMGRGQLLGMIGWETLTLIAFGLLSAAFVVAVTMGVTTWAYARHVFVEVPLDVYVIAALAALLAMLSSLIPTQLAVRTRPMDALSTGE